MRFSEGFYCLFVPFRADPVLAVLCVNPCLCKSGFPKQVLKLLPGRVEQVEFADIIFYLSGQSGLFIDVCNQPGNVCVIQDSSNRKVAYNSVIKGLKRKGFSVKRVGAGQTKNCSRVFSCQSISRWQIANYTSNIHLQYWEHGKLVSEAKYDAPTNGINISKFISTEDKIFQLLNEMLPGTRTLPSKYNSR